MPWAVRLIAGVEEPAAAPGVAEPAAAVPEVVPAVGVPSRLGIGVSVR